MNLLRTALCSLLFTAFLLAQTSNVAALSSASAVTINQTANTPIYNPLQGANTVQIYIRPSSTAQVYTLTLEDGTTVEIPSGGNYTWRANIGINGGVRLCRVQTATGSVVLQVVAFKESR